MKKLTTKTRKPLAAARSALERVTSAFDGVPVRARKARKALGALGSDGVQMLKRHPVRSIVGALAAGVAIKKLASRA
jgi:hypothetical protein